MSGVCGSSQIPGALLPTSFLQKPLHIAIEIRGRPSTSSPTLVVAAAGHSARSPQGARHQRLLHLWWCVLPDISPAPPRSPSSTSSSTVVVDAARDTGSTAKGAYHRRLLQLWWQLLPEFLPAPPRGAIIDVFFQLWSWMLPNILPTPPREPAIYVFFNFGGCCCRNFHQHP
jgi:hypothetical protein